MRVRKLLIVALVVVLGLVGVVAARPEILVWMGLRKAAELCGCDLTATIQNPDLHTGTNEGAAVVMPPGVEKKPYGEAEAREEREPDGARVKVVRFRDFFIDRIYHSMRGPGKLAGVVLGTPQDKNLWITQYRAEVIDPKSGSASQEYMCHTNMNEVGVEGGPSASYSAQKFLISQGQKEITFPKGFGLRIPNTPDKQFEIFAMVLNNNDEKINRHLDFEARVKYYGDAEASRMGLTPLFMTGCQIFAITDPKQAKPGETVVEPATPDSVVKNPEDGRSGCGHWMVPPGRQVLSTDVTRQLQWDMTVHYLFMHLHPYAVSMELRDKTAGKSLWKGMAHNAKDPKRAVLVETDSYCSAEGFRMYKGHQYELISVYDNPTEHAVDAMASLWMYVSVDYAR